jgi:hypothetical protein
MGMYTELYLSFKFRKDTPKQIIDWIKAHDDNNISFEELLDLIPEPIKGTRLRTLYSSSAYFDSITTCEITEDYKFLCIFNIKNYNEEIQKLLDMFEPFIDSYGHIGHIRYEEYDLPDIIEFKDNKIKIHYYQRSISDIYPIIYRPNYLYQIEEKLKQTQKPFATRVSNLIRITNETIDTLEIMSDAIINLENLSEEYQNELIQYKLRYGQLQENKNKDECITDTISYNNKKIKKFMKKHKRK